MSIESELLDGLSMRPIDAISNIADLLAASEVCLCSTNKAVQGIASELIDLAHQYAKEARVQGGVA